MFAPVVGYCRGYGRGVNRTVPFFALLCCTSVSGSRNVSQYALVALASCALNCEERFPS